MAITEGERHRLYKKLESTIGDEEATTLMQHLPREGWTDVARHRDLDHQDDLLRGEISRLEQKMDAGFATLRAEMNGGFASVRADFNQSMRTYGLGIIGVNATVVTLATGLVTLVSS